LGSQTERWEDASSQLLQPTYHHEHPADRSVLESPPSLAFAVEWGFHAARPVETLAGSVIEFSLV
jgi:hypothetical protein